MHAGFRISGFGHNTYPHFPLVEWVFGIKKFNVVMMCGARKVTWQTKIYRLKNLLKICLIPVVLNKKQ